LAALIAWMLVVRVGDVVKDGAKRRRLRRSSILDNIANTNRVLFHAIKAAFWAYVLHPSKNAAASFAPAAINSA
jgi:hypothetical protein